MCAQGLEEHWQSHVAGSGWAQGEGETCGACRVDGRAGQGRASIEKGEGEGWVKWGLGRNHRLHQPTQPPTFHQQVIPRTNMAEEEPCAHLM